MEALESSLQQRKDAIVADELRKRDAELAAAMDDGEREAILKRYEASVKKLDSYMQVDKKRQEVRVPPYTVFSELPSRAKG